MILRLQEADYGTLHRAEMERMNDRVNRLFEEITDARACVYPLVNVRTSEEGAVLTAELPGCRADEIDITVIGSSITLKGTKKVEQPAGEKVLFHRRERRSGSFERTLKLPRRIDRDKVEAHYQQGILSITAAWKEDEKGSKIHVN